MAADLPRLARIRRPAEFKQAFARGFRVTRPPLAAVCRLNELGLPRLGLALARKAVPTAVGRNRIKRLLREEFRQVRHTLPAVDVVFYALPGLAKAPPEQLRSATAEIWSRVIVRCAHS